MGIEPSGLQEVLHRIAEISNRFGLPPLAPLPRTEQPSSKPAQTGAAGRWEPTTASGSPGSGSAARTGAFAYGLPPGTPEGPGGEASTQAFDFEAALAQAARRSGVDPRLLAAVVRVESGGDPRSRSPKGAMGLMQIMPETARDYGVDDPWDPVQNMTGGGKYLKNMIRMFGGDLALGLAAYNAGEGAVARHKGIPPYKETQAFVRRVLDLYQANQP